MPYNSILTAAQSVIPLQDNAANTDVAAWINGTPTAAATLSGGDNTADKRVVGPGSGLPYALQGNGTDDYISVANFTTTDYTVAFWAKGNSFTELMGVACWDNFPTNPRNAIVYKAITAASSRAESYANGTGAARDFASTPGSFHHVALVRSGTTLTPYYNAAAQTAITIGSGSRTFSNGRLFAHYYSGATREFSDAALAGFVRYNSAASGADVTDLYNGPEPAYSSGGTLGANGAYDVGNWRVGRSWMTWFDGLSLTANGTITYEKQLVNSAGTTLETDVASTDTTGTFSTSLSDGTYYLYVKASNDGGADEGDHGSRSTTFGASGDGFYEVASVTVTVITGARVITVRRPPLVVPVTRPARVITVPTKA